MFERLAAAMGRPELASATMDGPQHKRPAARDEIDRIVTAWVGAHDRAGTLEKCLADEVPAGEVNSSADIFADGHFQARGNWARFSAGPAGRRNPQAAPAVRRAKPPP